MQDKKAWLQELIIDFVENNPENRMGERFGDNRFWGKPLVGFASGADEIFANYKDPEICGPDHWTPEEAFTKAFPETKASGKELTVISWILPQTEQTKAALRKEKDHVCEEWGRSRVYGEFFNEALRKHVIAVLAQIGIAATAPTLLKDWSRMPSEHRTITSTWSERHAAHACGLGTFGLCDGLITPVGKAHRVGTVIANLSVQADARPYASYNEYCLFYAKGNCPACMQRCPVEAITPAGHNKLICRDFVHVFNTKYIKEHFHFEGYGCGLCQTKVPCESCIP